MWKDIWLSTLQELPKDNEMVMIKTKNARELAVFDLETKTFLLLHGGFCVSKDVECLWRRLRFFERILYK